MTARAAILVLLVVAGPASASGVVIHARQRDGDTTAYLDGKRLRFDDPGDARAQITIFDGVAHRLCQLDTRARTYWETTEADGKLIRARLDAALASIPPERRKRFEEAMNRREQPRKREVKFVPLGSHQEVAGFGCDGYRLLRDGKPEREGCYIPWSSRAVSKGDLDGLRELGRFSRAILANAFGAGAPAVSGAPFLEEIENAPGFPAVLDDLTGGARGNTHRLVSIQHERIPPGTFAVPGGYRKVANPLARDAAKP